MKNHDQFYSFAEAYDVAFDFKDIKAECQFLVSVFERHNLRRPRSFLDLAAGPALHAIQMALNGIDATALDLSKEMVDYASMKSKSMGASIHCVQADIASFNTDEKFDLAGIFMDSTSYLLNNEAVISHLNSVANSLNDDGIYILEMSHPRDVFSVGTSTTNSWETERNGLWTSIAWGSEGDVFDPISQLTETSVKLIVRKDGEEKELFEKAPQRCFTANEFKALVAAEGSFEVMEIYGAMKHDVPFSNEKVAWRMIPVLRKVNK